jgi:hypothetical protein
MLAMNTALSAEPDDNVVYKVFYTISYADPAFVGQFMGSGTTGNLHYQGSSTIEFDRPLVSLELHPFQLTFLFTQLPDDGFRVDLLSQQLPKYPDTYAQTIFRESLEGQISETGKVSYAELVREEGEVKLDIALRLSRISLDSL